MVTQLKRKFAGEERQKQFDLRVNKAKSFRLRCTTAAHTTQRGAWVWMFPEEWMFIGWKNGTDQPSCHFDQISFRNKNCTYLEISIYMLKKQQPRNQNAAVSAIMWRLHPSEGLTQGGRGDVMYPEPEDDRPRQEAPRLIVYFLIWSQHLSDFISAVFSNCESAQLPS